MRRDVWVAALGVLAVLCGCPAEDPMPPAFDAWSDATSDGSVPPDAGSDEGSTTPDAAPQPVVDGVFGPPGASFTLPTPNEGSGIYLPDIQASHPEVDWQGINRLYIPAGHYPFIRIGNLPDRSADNRLVITNIGGQVRVGGLDHYYLFVVGGGSHWVLTGRYDPVSATGDEGFPGHRAGAYANSRGTYGLLVDDAFIREGNTGLAVGEASDIEVEFIEITRAEFAGMMLKKDDGDVDMVNVAIHDLYIHDVGSEGIYFGSTQGQPQHRIMGLRFFNNRVLRCGTELMQIGQVGGGSEIHNNVFAMGALDWKSPFQNYQDNASQMAPRMGSVTVHHNVFIGGASNMINMHPVEAPNDTHNPSDVVAFLDNYYSHSRQLGAYIGSYANGATTYRLANNTFRQFVFSYDEVTDNGPNAELIRIHGSQSNPIELVGNTWDGSIALSTDRPNVTATDNTNTESPAIAFHDFGFPADFDFFRVEMWTDVTAPHLGSEPVFYDEGDYVMWDGHLYRNIEPGAHTDKFPPDHPTTWELQPDPPDDVRPAAGSPYPGVGLLDAP